MELPTDVRAWVGALELWQMALAAVLMATLLMAARAWGRPSHRRGPASAAEGTADPRVDRFGCLSPITTEEAQMLRFLQQAFFDEAVLFRPPLAKMLTVRKSPSRRRAAAWLQAQRVDYLVCGMDGQPICAFDIDRTREHTDDEAMREAADKKLLLRTAGLRLIRLRGSARRMPPPGELRERVLRDGLKPMVAGPSGFAPSAFGAPGHEPSQFGLSAFGGAGASGFGPSGFDGRHGAEDSAWADVRKRS
ncbi:MAG: DUF2726 domain-containing protein [Pseudomonadota bacterium]|nr:DUF2726 domain-containing protein [Pseudomonadota bacterium]